MGRDQGRFPSWNGDRLHWWYGDGVVEEYLSKNDGNLENWSFLDGPITANNPMGVHHDGAAPTSDLWVRYYTMPGHRQRYQNGFDCQGPGSRSRSNGELGFTRSETS
ncbi:MAG: class I tRNA ligase family protein [Thermomicrobiales bacterium]